MRPPRDAPTEVEADERFGAVPEAVERMVEALLFASAEPVSERELRAALPEGADVRTALERLAVRYEGRACNCAAPATVGRSAPRRRTVGCSSEELKSGVGFPGRRWRHWPSSPTTNR